MTTETRTAQQYWDRFEVIFNDTYKDFTAHFGVSVNAQHALRDAIATNSPHIPEHQAHHDGYLLRRVRGCFQHHIAMAGLPEYLKGNGNLGFYTEQTHFGSKYAAEFFGTNLSHARENDIAARLAAGVNTEFTKDDPRWRQWLDLWDNITLESVFGNWLLEFGGESRTLNSGSSIEFDADETVTLTPPALFPDEIINSRVIHRLNIADGFKMSLTAIKPDSTEETVTTTADGEYSITGQAYSDNKLPEQSRFRMTFSSE